MNRLLWTAAILCGLAGTPAAAQQSVDLELVLLADASGSIDDAEIAFQRNGYATAIVDPIILEAIGRGRDGRIAVAYVEWGNAASQDVVVPWTVVDGPPAASGFATALMQAPRVANGSNAIGSAIAAGHALIERNNLNGRRKVIDFSGDSDYSFGGIPVAAAREAALASGIVINGLAVLCRRCSGPPVSHDLVQAFADRIIGGPGSFVIGAESGEKFVEAVRKKLFLEVSGGSAPDTLANRPSGHSRGIQIVDSVSP